MPTAAAIRATAPSISATGACSPSSYPSGRATAELELAIARQPGRAAKARALATSHAFGSTSSGGELCILRSSSARVTPRRLSAQGSEQPVSHPPLVLDEVRRRVGGAELAAQTRGVRVHRARPRARAEPPHVAEELGLREHPLRVGRQAHEQV